MKKLVMALVLTLSMSVAAREESGTIKKLLVHDSGTGTVVFDVKLEGSSESDMLWCDSSIKEWSGDLLTEGGRAQYAMLLTAYISGQSIRLHSDSTAVCPLGKRNRIRNAELIK